VHKEISLWDVWEKVCLPTVALTSHEVSHWKICFVVRHMWFGCVESKVSTGTSTYSHRKSLSVEKHAINSRVWECTSAPTQVNDHIVVSTVGSYLPNIHHFYILATILDIDLTSAVSAPSILWPGQCWTPTVKHMVNSAWYLQSGS
jgi:hypothetical protein